MSAQELDWNDLRFVLAVLRTGTLSAAARTLGVNHSTVFRRVRAVEERVGSRLFDRLPTGYVATVEGESVRDAAERIEAELFNLSRLLAGQDLRPHGLVRFAGPDALTLHLLMPLLARFQALYPEIELDVRTANAFADLARREADVVVRSTTTPPETAVGRKLCTLAATFYATPETLASVGTSNMTDFKYVLPDDSFEDYKPAIWLRRTHPDCTVIMRSNTLMALHEAARLGVGVAPLPCFLGDDDPALARVRPPQQEFASEVWLLTHADLRTTARIRALMDFLAAEFGTLEPLLNGSRGPRHAQNSAPARR
ncbi:MAG: LysR family transcriptional regulator [Nannocystales bacterium]